MKRVTILVPNYLLRQDFGEPSAPPIGAALVAASLRKRGYDVTCVDADAENYSLEETVEKALETEPDFVGISCNYITKHNPTIKLSQQVKKNSEIFIFVGGNHASAYSHALFESSKGTIDVILKGECELSAPLLLDAVNEKLSIEDVPGACVYRNGKTVEYLPPTHVKELDRLPLPAYDLFPMEKYTRHGLMTSRGCPYRCSYCASNAVSGKGLRFKSTDYLVQEISFLRDNYGEKFIWFCDDTFTINPSHVNDVVQAIAKLDPLPKWSCLASAATVSSELLFEMKNAGCEYLSIGIESTHPDHKRFLGKPISDDLVINAVNMIHEARMRAFGFFIIGFPGENRETLNSRLKLIEKAGFDGVATNILIPLPGTALWEELVSKKLLNPQKLKMDYLFARMLDENVIYYPARLAEKWTQLTAAELGEAVAKCKKTAELAIPQY